MKSSIWLGAFAAVAVACGSEAATDDLFGKAGSGGSAQGGSGASTGGASGSAGSGANSGGLGGVGGFGGMSGIGGNGTGGAVGAGAALGSGGEADAALDAPTSDGSDPDGAGGSMGVGGSGNASASVDCGGSACEISQGSVCCRSTGGGFGGGPFGGFGGSGFGGSGSGGASTTCSSGSCNNNATRIFCDGPEDCAAGSACCASYQNLGPTVFYSELVCRPSGDCAGPGRRIVCAPGSANPCPNGGNCQQSMSLPSGYEICG